MKKYLFITSILYVPTLFATVISKGQDWDITGFMIESTIGNTILYVLAIGSFILWILAILHWSKSKNKDSLEVVLLILLNVFYTPYYYWRKMR